MTQTASASIGDSWTRAEHSTFTWLLEPMLQHAGLVIEDATYSEDQIFARYVCRRAK